MEHREHEWYISTGTIVRILLVFAVAALVFILRDIVLILLMSIVIASAIEPATSWLHRHRVPRLLSVILVYLTIIAGIILVVFFLLLPLLSQSTDFLKNVPNYFNATAVSSLINHNQFLSSQPAVESLKNAIDFQGVINQINGLITSISSNTFGSVAKIFGGVLSFLLIFILSFYLSVEEDGVGKFLKIVTPLKHERYVISLWRRSQKKIGLWMQGQLILAVIIGMLVYLGLLILNMPNPLLLAVLAGAFEIIPLFGPILASVPAITIGFVTGGFSFALLILGFYIIIHQFENQLIYPLVVKKVVGVSPVVSIVALVAGYELLGFLGLILSVPVASIVIEFFDDYERDKIERFEKMSASGRSEKVHE